MKDYLMSKINNFAMKKPLRKAIGSHFHMTRNTIQHQPLGTYICNDDTTKCHITSLKTLTPDVLKLSNAIVESQPLSLKPAQGFVIHDGHKLQNDVYFKNDNPIGSNQLVYGRINFTDTQDTYNFHARRHFNNVYNGTAAVLILGFLKLIK